MERLPSNIILDIFSKVPVKCLALSRCVSKVWCNYIDDRYLTVIHDKRLVEEPTPIFYHQHRGGDRSSLCFHVIESIQTTSSFDYVLKPKEGPFFEFLRMKPLSTSYEVRIQVQGSCNGVVCLSQDVDHVVNSLVAVHPLRKECYEVPPLPFCFRFMSRESCGLGFDDSTNTFKMVCVFFKEYAPPDTLDLVRKNLCTMVHVFGTNSWRKIPQAPSYPITGEAIYSNGCLHWLVSNLDSQIKEGGRETIWFDVKKEEFGLINPPKQTCDPWRFSGSDHLVDLNGEVGYVFNSTMEVWVLKHKKEWLLYCQFGKYILFYFNNYVDILGCWNKDGDMVIRIRGDGKYKFYVYNIKNDVLHKTNIVGPFYGFSPNIIMHPNKLFSIHGIDANTFPMKKTNPKKSCRRLLSYD